MDSHTKRRLFLGFLSNWIAKLAGTIVQFVQIPVFLHFWSVPLYGEWMIVNSIPSYLSFSNVGFGNVAGNEMTMMVARDDYDGAVRVFQSCWWLIVLMCSVTLFLLCGALYVLPAGRLLKLTHISDTDTRWIIFYLGISVLLGQVEQLMQAAYRSIGRYPFGSFLKSMISLAAFTFMIISVALGAGARVAALALASANAAGTLLQYVMVRRDVAWLKFGWRYATFSEIRRLTRPAIAFMGFPLGNALNLQGAVLAVGYALGPVAVVVFGTARTVSRVALQMSNMVGGTFEPEMSIAYGAGNYPLIRSLLRRACQMAVFVSLAVVAVMMVGGPWFLNHWTGGHVPPSRGLLSILLAVVVVYSFWATAATLLTSTNQHQRLAAYYILGTAANCVLCYFLGRSYGLYGAAASLLVSEIVMNTYVVPAALRISRDTLPAFLSSMTHYPPSLRPSALFSRFRRSTADLEG